MRRLIAAALLAGGCASPGAPPGGPPDAEAPRLLGVAPDSGQTGISPREVVFRFNEVVSERPAGAPSLADLFMISPRRGTPSVSWSRSEVAVRPRNGWRRNTIYTVTLRPGVADLRGNASTTGAVIVFSTDGPIPDTRVTGQVFDWMAGTTAPAAIVQAMTPDSVIYITVADSAGSFELAHLPPGRLILEAILDANRNWGRDPGEKFDTLTITLADTVHAELLTYTQDSVPPRLADATIDDPLHIRLLFDMPLDPAQTLTPEQFTVVAPDTTAIAVVRATLQPSDAAPAVPLPRPAPPRAVILELNAGLRPGATYAVRSRNVRGLNGVAGLAERSVRVPAPPPPPSPTDSAPPSPPTPNQ